MATVSNYYLVQRLRHQHETSKPFKAGFDRYFQMEYMGSAEFENGEAFRSLKRIRAAGAVTVTVRSLTVDDVTRDVHFVAHPATAEEQWNRFLAWAAGTEHAKPFRVCEYTRFPQQFAGEERALPTDAWWALDTDTAWALTAEDAATLAEGFNAKPAA
jgi:hypothetical protein